MAEYRIEELAKVSGVSSRNIRAYRERGLLEPPRRVGRTAVYGDRHLTQLQVINRLLGKGFNSAHIADFFEAVREGHDLADLLGLRAITAATRRRDADLSRSERAAG
ncbi:MerR family transcriptional regulator [Mycolicibacterium komossense]|uniref:MerR family transcriptional regulator n=1 Tax=Mycolicibacterium komossense TaxID=1779 RepID=A0ABT3C7W8_9MYCO|nr:MerR family transcriptional regulator [Mycolicibacterium komossense]